MCNYYHLGGPGEKPGAARNLTLTQEAGGWVLRWLGPKEDSDIKSKDLSEELSDYDFSKQDDVRKNTSTTMQPPKTEIAPNNSTMKSNKEKLKEVESKFSREDILKAYKMMKLMKQNKIVKTEEDETKTLSQ